MSLLTIPNITDKSQLIDWLISNKTALIAQKKSVMKKADAVFYAASFVNEKGTAYKADVGTIPDTVTKLKVRSIINTTLLYDSHQDVHIDQLWNKSLKENKENYLCNQHDFSFEGTVSDNVHAFVKRMLWKELGYDFEGDTQALVFDSIIERNKYNELLFDKYRTGKVKQHSVGMRYVRIELAVNDDRYEKEFANWEKYYPMIANKEDIGSYFWPVLEAKIIEGSAVMKGSNFVTPTQSVSETKHIQPPAGTGSRAAKSTQVLAELNNILKKLPR